MTTNAFIFMWDCNGIESIIPISQYELVDRNNTLRILKGESVVRNPLTSILQNLMLRARFNSHRCYEIYAVDCDKDMDMSFWEEKWKAFPQETSDLIRSHGHKLYSANEESATLKK